MILKELKELRSEGRLRKIFKERKMKWKLRKLAEELEKVGKRVKVCKAVD